MVKFPKMYTPALIVDLPVFTHNVDAAEEMLKGSNKVLRPHFKSHNTPALALRQLSQHTNGVTCATLGEVEAVVNAGIKNVLIANEIVTLDKINNVANIAQKAKITVCVDAIEPLRLLSKTCEEKNVILGVLVDLDVGLGRCGVKDVHKAVDLARKVSEMPGLEFKGIMGYEGRVRATMPNREIFICSAYNKLAETKEAIEKSGLQVDVVSAAGTSTLPEALADETITEIQAGTYALMESDLDGLGLPFRCAVYVLGTVISVSPGRAVLDVGRKTIGDDYGLPILIHNNGKTESISDEHIILEWKGDLPPIGSSLKLRPSQNRTTFNLYDEVWLTNGHEIVDRVPIAPRG